MVDTTVLAYISESRAMCSAIAATSSTASGHKILPGTVRVADGINEKVILAIIIHRETSLILGASIQFHAGTLVHCHCEE
jgi:hypothetical protein